MIHFAARILPTTLLATGLLCFAPAARANDGGVDTADSGLAMDAAGQDGGGATHDSGPSHDSSVTPGTDASVPHGCIANGEPCNQSETCCLEESYCGAFGGTGASLVCGSNTSNALSTSSCAVSHDAGVDVVWLLGAVGLVVALRRRSAR